MAAKRTPQKKAQKPEPTLSPGMIISVDPRSIVIPGVDPAENLPSFPEVKGAKFKAWSPVADENGKVTNIEAYPLYDLRVKRIIEGNPATVAAVEKFASDFTGSVGQIHNLGAVLVPNDNGHAMVVIEGNNRTVAARKVVADGDPDFRVNVKLYGIGKGPGMVSSRQDVLDVKLGENLTRSEMTAREIAEQTQEYLDLCDGDRAKASAALGITTRTLTNRVAYLKIGTKVIEAYEQVTGKPIPKSKCMELLGLRNLARETRSGEDLEAFMVEASKDLAAAPWGQFGETFKAWTKKANENLTEAEAEAKAKAEAEAKAKAERRKATAQVLRNLAARLSGAEGDEYRKGMSKAALAALDQLRAAQAVLSGEAEMPEALASAWAKIQADEAKAKADAEKAAAKAEAKAVTPKADNGEALINMAKAFAANGVSRDALEAALAAANAKGREAALKAYDEAVKG